jgi:hypothetical protein
MTEPSQGSSFRECGWRVQQARREGFKTTQERPVGARVPNSYLCFHRSIISEMGALWRSKNIPHHETKQICLGLNKAIRAG